MTIHIQGYIDLLTAFISKKISVLRFEQKFLQLFKSEETDLSGVEFKILDRLFADVDAFCADPQLREKGDLDEGELREKCKVALLQLQALEHAHA